MVTSYRSVGRVFTQARAGLYVCQSCRHQISQSGASIHQRRFLSKDDAPTSAVQDKGSYKRQDFVERRRSRKQSERDDAERQAAASVDTQANAINRRNATPGARRKSKKTEQDYSRPETWDGMKWIGSSGNWRHDPPNMVDDFSTWLTSSKPPVRSRDELLSCLHQALVECLTCNQAGLDPNSTTYIETSHTHGSTLDAFASANITLSEDGTLEQVQFASEAQAQEIVELLAAVDNASPAAPNASEEAEAEQEQQVYEAQSTQQGYTSRYEVQDVSFLHARLDSSDPTTFAILKRFSQISGHRIPDPVLSTILSAHKSLSDLIDQVYDVVVKPKPTKVADVLLSKPGLNTLGNLMIFPRRATSIDNEKEIGRWKIIEKELRDRGLPVTGNLKA